MKNQIICRLLVLVFGAAATGSIALAQDAKPESTKTVPVKGHKVELNFENELIEGAVEKPDLELVRDRMPQTFKRLLKLRENFTDEAHKGEVQFEHSP